MMAQPSLALGPRQVVGEADFQKCMVCGTDSGRSARLLKCLHNVCEECLADSLSAPDNSVSGGDSSRKSILCYLCQATSEVATVLDGPGSLLKNYVLTRQWLRNRLLRSITTAQSAACSTDAENLQQLVCDECDVCPEDADEVVAVCYDCCSTLCADHLRIHKKTRSSAKHAVCELASIGTEVVSDSYEEFPEKHVESQPSSCQVHAREVCTFICEYCHTVFCKLCHAMGGHSHSPHVVRELNQEFLNSAEEHLKAGMRKVDSRLKQISSRVALLAKDEDRARDKAESLSTEITDLFADLKERIVAKLESEEKALLEKVDKHHWAISRTLSRLKQPLEQERWRLQQAKCLVSNVERVHSEGDRAVFASGLQSSLLCDSSGSLSTSLDTNDTQTSKVNDLDLSIEWTPVSEFRPLLESSSAGRMASKRDQSSEPTRISSISRPRAPNDHAVARPATPLASADQSSREEKPTVRVAECEVSYHARSCSKTEAIARLIVKTESAAEDLPAKISLFTFPFPYIVIGGVFISPQAHAMESCKQKASSHGRGAFALDFNVTPISGTYDVLCKELGVSHRLILPPPPFLFTDAALHNTVVSNNGQTLAVKNKKVGGAATCDTIMEFSNDVTWTVAYCTLGSAKWESALGVVCLTEQDVGTSVGWRKSHTAVVYSDIGDIYHRASRASTLKARCRFDNRVSAHDWSGGAILKLRLRKTGSCDFCMTLDVGGSPGDVHMNYVAEEIRPYFWLSPETTFTLLPPY
eukprot:scpid38370/ scgid30884/ E3 ubiquitin-protein ligase TRIM33; Ectodermin; Transcription intermediary factor 1-gamma; Tripartite motif-containing protein 33